MPWKLAARTITATVAAVFATTALAPLGALAQARPGVLSGVVTSDAGRPLQGALVVLDPEGNPRRADTDAEGRFRFERVGAGQHELRVVLVGFLPDERTVRMEAAGLDLAIALQRAPTRLDTLRIVARETGVFGTVVDRASFTPLGRASVSVMGTRFRATTDSSGKFTILGLRPGAYVVFTRAPKLLPSTISVVVPLDSAVELLVAMSSLDDPGAKRLAMPLEEFDRRVMAALKTKSALVPRQELAGKGSTVGDALRYAPSFLRTALRLTQSICLYVDGLPRPITTVYDIPVETVDRVEVYGLRALQEGALRQWPAGAPCGNPSGPVNPRAGTGPAVRSPSGGASGRFGLQAGSSSRREPMDDFVRVVVVWLRR